MHTLIHETNHLLQKEDIAFIEEKSGTKKLGISGMTERSDVLVDETINDYISKDVLDVFLTLYDGDLTMLDPTFHGGYLVIDSVCDNIGFRTYSLLKEDIKNNFINGNARKIKKIINFSNRYNYSSLQMMFQIVKENMEQKVAKNENLTFKDYFSSLAEEKKHTLKAQSNEIFRSIKSSYSEYKNYEQSISSYVDNLEKNGQANRIK